MSRSLVVVGASRTGEIESEMGPVGRTKTACLPAFIPARRVGHLLRQPGVVKRATAPLPSRHCDARAPTLDLPLTMLDCQTIRGGGQSIATLLGNGEKWIGVSMRFKGEVFVGALERVVGDGNRGGSRDVVDRVGQAHGRRA